MSYCNEYYYNACHTRRAFLENATFVQFSETRDIQTRTSFSFIDFILCLFVILFIFFSIFDNDYEICIIIHKYHLILKLEIWTIWLNSWIPICWCLQSMSENCLRKLSLLNINNYLTRLLCTIVLSWTQLL